MPARGFRLDGPRGRSTLRPTERSTRWRSTSGKSRRDSASCAAGKPSCGGVFDLDTKRSQLRDLEAKTADPELWNQRELAEKLLKQKRELEREVEVFDQLAGRLSDAEVLLELATEADDEATVREAGDKVAELRRELDQVELRRLLSGEHDDNPAIVSINAGAGGTEASDWAQMLLRMYLRWCERGGYKTEMLDLQEGEGAGIKSATFTVEGDHPFGYLRTEVGIHRLVRISPFDAQHRRHTSFASFTMVPDIGDDVEVDLD